MEHHYDRYQVEQQVNRLEYNEDYFDLIQENARYYLPYIVSEVQKRGLPMEIALLPIIESSLNPFAVSRSNAKGLWQFIPSTGYIYDLYGDHWEDDRRDVIRSTQAGLDYLEKLYDMFGDWSLAMGAYNGGPGTIQRAQRKNERSGRDTDYWSLKVYKETRQYVPKILAMARVIKNPSRYGITLRPLGSSTLSQHPVMGPVSLTQVANCAQMSFEEFYRYNAQYRRANTDYKQHLFVLPESRSSTFDRNFSRGVSKCK
ncbi:MAG: transglycosylase SLT domain-containing protein, partial [Pseudomonadota bacterium]